jgi:hypothetical protein
MRNDLYETVNGDVYGKVYRVPLFLSCRIMDLVYSAFHRNAHQDFLYFDLSELKHAVIDQTDANVNFFDTSKKLTEDSPHANN